MRKKYERNMREDRRKELIMNVETEEEITFSSKDLNDGGSQDDPMVIKLDIANFTVHKVLVDNGSSADNIFWDVLKRMGLEDSSLSPVQTPLVGFGGSEVASMGTIDLPLLMGEEPKRRTIIVRFLVVDTPFAYNVILGRPGLNLFRAVVSTYHQKMKFPTKNGTGEVSYDQREARKCYNLSLRKVGQEERMKRKEREETEERKDSKKFKPERIEPAEEHKSIELVVGEPDKTTRIGSNMSKSFETMMIEFLRRSIDMFAWSPSDFKGATYQRLVNKMFKDQIGVIMEVYVEDMLVKSRKEDDHLRDLKQAFEIMRVYGMKLPKQIHFWSTRWQVSGIHG
ncbi:UNVERIFIED_CONTAM: hypothetical protein Slati_1337900 [Sesamum latifolium]|uniref:Reverse transcriptase domain-containing protein n=1 Tax=Sesamum latifolium TaxID=2727402 RepID=A0AAW2XHX5_9LAMI